VTTQNTSKGHSAFSGIRTHSPKKLVAADPRLTPSGHWDRQLLEKEL